MGSYKALYRKYRPQTFDEVVDQEYVTRTIKNAITLNRISHAYLFNGPRGIGKTSIARIFAKAINCQNPNGNEPCCECEVCQSIVNGTNPDIIEIDAASRTKVEQMRETLEKVSYLPSICKYKVYIIDEVHMLSSSSFNALLKTLEEPPQHVVFVLCTTEIEKVIPTIRSRCQRFDFHLVSKEAMTNRLRYISDNEGINITDDALNTISEVSEGGMRDSLSLLDQISSFSINEKITEDDVLEVSGGLSARSMISMAEAINKKDSSSAITILDEMVKNGKDIERINQGMITFFKDILVEKNTGRSIGKVGYDTDSFKNIKDSIRNERLFGYIDILTSAMNDYRFSTNKRLYFELALIKMCDVGANHVQNTQTFREEETKSAGYDPNKTYSAFVHKQEERPVSTIFDDKKVEKMPSKPVDQPVKEEKKEIPPQRQEEPLETKKEDPVPAKNEWITVEHTDVKAETKEETVPIKNEEESVQEAPEERPMDEKSQNEAVPKEEFEFDVRFVEDILNNADKGFKMRMIEQIENGKASSSGTEFYKFAMLMTGGRIEASSSTSFVMSFQSVGSCNLIMKEQNKKGVIEFIENCTGKKMDFLALTTSVFKQISDEFVTKFKANLLEGRKERITLTQIHCHGLRLNEQVRPEEDTQVTKLKGMFGDLLTIKE